MSVSLRIDSIELLCMLTPLFIEQYHHLLLHAMASKMGYAAIVTTQSGFRCVTDVIVDTRLLC